MSIQLILSHVLAENIIIEVKMMNKRKFSLDDMISIQKDLNEKTVPGWQDVLTEDHFRVALLSEASEMIDSLSWKWWKNTTQNNMWNLKIEAIDMLHFSLSILMLRQYQKHVLCDNDYFGFDNDEKCTVSVIDRNGQMRYTEFVSVIMPMLECTTSVPFNTFFRSIGMSCEEISAIYIAKSTLNGIRQERGYKTGEYRKIIGNKEDNEFLESIVNDFMTDKSKTLNNVKQSVIDVFDKIHGDTNEMGDK